MDWLELNSDDIVMGPTVEVMKEYAGHIIEVPGAAQLRGPGGPMGVVKQPP